MNRVFKTKWSAAHQQYVVTDEHHATKGKAAKSAVAIAVAAFMMAAGARPPTRIRIPTSAAPLLLKPSVPLKRPNTRRTGVLQP